jgi:hypothetical protein
LEEATVSEIPPSQREVLELRYDGPIPPQHLDHAGARRRRQRGNLSLLEAQASQFLDAAERCQADMEDLAADMAEGVAGRLTGNDTPAQKLQATRQRCNAHIRAAAEALGRAMPLRRALGLSPHPVVALLDLLRTRESEIDK